MKPQTRLTLYLFILVISGGLVACNLQPSATPTPPLPPGYTIGPTNLCQATPQFVAALNFEQPVVDTTQELGIGLLITDLADNSRIYQHETWDDAGKVGAFAIDWLGNIFVAPAPVINQELNPVEEQNKVFRTDTQTAEMILFLDLPWPLPPSGSNPYGVLGLTYDCETSSLYVASVAGSTPQDEVGVIYQVSADTGEILSQQENTDALGLGVFNSSQGKRLYYGAGRTPDVYSVALDGSGRIIGEPRLEFSLAAQPGGADVKAQRLQFTPENNLIVKALEFNYSLQATSRIEKTIFTFLYQPESDNWSLQEITTQ
ncbi:MAG: hypothetical protein KA314_15200 [Chloroflexi bacterium]|nr:hypothetical protein [Chloroflexota bacterium]MBP8057183.1 hypothetical protein [Chloroflexota bacterium]